MTPSLVNLGWQGPFQPGHALAASIAATVGGSVNWTLPQAVRVHAGSQYMCAPATASGLYQSDPGWWTFT